MIEASIRHTAEKQNWRRPASISAREATIRFPVKKQVGDAVMLGDPLAVTVEKERLANDKKKIQLQITSARESLLGESREEVKSKLTYNIGMDQVAYKTLAQWKDKSPKAYTEAKKDLDNYTEFQMRTALGERFNTGLSDYSYDLTDGVIYAEGATEPFRNMLERGRDYRRLHGSNDIEREDAEVKGFTKIEQNLADAPVDTMMLSISQRGKPGSIYQHNFYDVFTKKRREDGTFFVEARRYSSALDLDTSVNRLRTLQADYGGDQVMDDVYLLANPLKVSPEQARVKTADDLHSFLHAKHDVMNDEDFAYIMKTCTPYILYYINSLATMPLNDREHKLAYNAVLTIADIAANRLKDEKKGETIIFDRQTKRMPTSADVLMLGQQRVEQKKTGCGLSGSYAVDSPTSSVGVFSVLAFGEDQYGSLKFDCPSCKRKNTRKWGKLMTNCDHCGSAEVGC